MRYSWALPVILACATGAGPARGQDLRRGQGPPTRSSIDTLIGELGDFRYQVRDRATAQLAELQPLELDELVRRYRAEPGYEQRLRLRYAIESVYYRKLMAGQVGFLGVTMGPQPLPGVYDPKTGQTVECLYAEKMLENGAAEQGGMQAKDIMVEFDGQPVAKLMSVAAAKRKDKPEALGAGGLPVVALTSSPAIEAFTSHVKMREPGSRITMRVLRLGEPRAIRVAAGPEVTVDPRTLTPTMLSGDGSPVMSYVSGGLVVTHVPEHSWMSEAALRVNDTIVMIDGQQVPSGATADMLNQSFKMSGGNRRVVLVVRPMEPVELTMTLGARPPEMMNLNDWEEAQNRFAGWWRDTLGEASIRVRKARTMYFTPFGAAMPAESEAEVVP